MKNAEANAMLDKMLEKQRKENEKAALQPCALEFARSEAKYLAGWSKGKPITKFGDESSTFWKSGKWMTKISPQHIAGMIKHGFAVREGNTLRLIK